MASSSEDSTIVTNGMSYFDRSGENANSALLVSVFPEDYMKNDNPLSGVYFQKEIEEKAFKLAGSNYNAPSEKLDDYIQSDAKYKSYYDNYSQDASDVKPTYKPDITYCDLNQIFPEFVNKTLKDGIIYFDTKIKGFANPNCILTGPETRSSSPVTIVRDDKMNSSIVGLHPCGEGAGYAGGIMTSAIDGIRVAKSIIEM